MSFALKERGEKREAAEAEKDEPLRADIRLLGRMLGDTVREQDGADVFEIVERIRQASIRFHRDNEAGARRELEATLDSLDSDQTLSIVRAFSYFSHLANIAEDQHHIRRNRAHVRMKSEPRPGALPHAFKRAAEAGIDAAELRAFFDHALISPVLTAHPTEVRRKSTLTRELEIARLIDARHALEGDDVELARNEEQLRRVILILWRTNMLRQTRLRVIDEVANGLSYYDYTFFREMPRIYCAIEDELARQAPADAGKRIASFLRVGSWIGGDRDGNPYVTADVLSETMRLQSAAALSHYLEELHELGGELSLSDGLVPISDGAGGARRALDRRVVDPRATSPIGARSPASTRVSPRPRASSTMSSRPARPLIDAEPYASAAELAADLAIIDESLEANGGGDHRARPPAGVAPRGRRVRLPSRAARPAAEFRRPRAHRRRTLRHRQSRLRLSRARRGRAHRAADARARLAAAARLAVRRL